MFCTLGYISHDFLFRILFVFLFPRLAGQMTKGSILEIYINCLNLRYANIRNRFAYTNKPKERPTVKKSKTSVWLRHYLKSIYIDNQHTSFFNHNMPTNYVHKHAVIQTY